MAGVGVAGAAVEPLNPTIVTEQHECPTDYQSECKPPPVVYQLCVLVVICTTCSSRRRHTQN